MAYHLATNAINGDTSGAPLLHVSDHTLSFAVVGNVKVVIVDVKLGVRVSGTSSLECDADVVLADDLHPVALPEGAVFVEDLVGNVLQLSVPDSINRGDYSTHPSVDLALVATHDSLDVVLHDRDQGVLVIDLGDPSRQLAVPDKSVATDKLAVGLSPVDEVVSTAELEVATRRLGSIELHRVLRCDLAKVVLGDVADVALVESSLVTSGTPVPRKMLGEFMYNRKLQVGLTSCPWP